MHTRNFLNFASVVFFLIFLGHGARLVYGWEVVIGGIRMPLSVSAYAAFIGLILAWSALKLRR